MTIHSTSKKIEGHKVLVVCGVDERGYWCEIRRDELYDRAFRDDEVLGSASGCDTEAQARRRAHQNFEWR